MLLIILMENKFLEPFTKTNCKKQITKSLKLKKSNQKKCQKLYLKWKGYDDLFISWINRKNIV